MPISLPAVRYLLAIGFHHVRQVGRYGWLYAANAALNLLDGAVAGHAAKLLTGFTGVVLLLVATRQILTGNVTFGPRDILASLRLLGLLILSMLPIMAVYGGLTFAAGARALTYPLFAVPVLAMLYVLTRLSFLLPALAVRDATGLGASFAQTRALWPLLLALAVIATVAGALLDFTVSVAGFPDILRTVLAALVGTAALLFTQAPICWLYARTTGRDASAVAP